MRIAYLITRADAVGGASIHVRDLSRAMRSKGHEVCVFVGGNGPVTDHLEADGTPYVSLSRLRRAIDPAADFEALREIHGQLRAWSPELVSTHTAKAGFLGRRAAHRLGIPAFYTPHGWSIGDRMSRAQGMVYTAAERLAARWTTAVICVCEYERQLAMAKLPALRGKLHVIYNGVRDTPLRADPGKSPPRIVSVARFEAPKDPATLLKAMASLRDLPWQLCFIGDGPLLEPMRGLAARLNLQDRVEFAGYLQDPAVELARAQIFVLSSRSEAFPRSVLEAMRAGLPVVASDVGGVAEAVLQNVTGHTIPRDSPDRLAAGLRGLILDASQRQRLGAQGHLIWQQRFRIEQTVETTESLYDTVLKGESAR